MSLRRIFPIAACFALASIGFWQLTDTELLRVYGIALQQRQTGGVNLHQKQREEQALCQKYAQVSHLPGPLAGRAISIQAGQGASRADWLFSDASRAFPGAPVFVNGRLTQRMAFGLPQFTRVGAPPDAIVLTAEEMPLEDKNSAPGERRVLRVVTVTDGGKQIGRWQSLYSNACLGMQNRGVSLETFLTSQRSEELAILERARRQHRQRTMEFELTTVKTKQVGRAEDFNVPSSMANCQATLVRERESIQPSLQITAPGATYAFGTIRPDRTLPAVACNAEQTAVVFRTDTGVGVAVLSSAGYVLASGQIAVGKTDEREVFREVAIADGKVTALLVPLKVDAKGTLIALEAKLVTAVLPRQPEATPTKDAAAELGLAKHTACAPYPELDPAAVQVHELPGLGVSWEYVQAPGEAPVAFKNIVIDSPAQAAAISLPEPTAEMVWLIQATAGTDVRYVEISSALPQTVLLRGTGIPINIATDGKCSTLFGRNSSHRAKFRGIRPAYRERGQRETINVVLLGNGSPLITAESTYHAVGAFGFKHLSSLNAYLLELKGQGYIESATSDDYRRFGNHYYEGMPLTRKIASWFGKDPAISFSPWSSNMGYLVKRPFPLPKFPTSAMSEQFFFVDKGDSRPTGDLARYIIIDANTLSCPGAQRHCPWSIPKN